MGISARLPKFNIREMDSEVYVQSLGRGWRLKVSYYESIFDYALGKQETGMVIHVCNTSTQKTEAELLWSLKTVWTTLINTA